MNVADSEERHCLCVDGHDIFVFDGFQTSCIYLNIPPSVSGLYALGILAVDLDGCFEACRDPS